MENQTEKRGRGIFFIFVSAFFYATYGIWSRLMSHAFGEFSQAWSRGLLLLSVIGLINLKFKFFKPIKKQDWPWFIIIGLAGGLNQAPYFFGFKYLHIGTATLLFYAALVIGGYLIGKLAFKEKLTKVKIISLVLALVGMLVIYNLTLSPSQFLAAGLTIMAGLMGACSGILPKKLSTNYEELQILSFWLLVMFVANGILSFVFHETLPGFNQKSVWLGQLGYAFAMLLANWAVIEGYKHIEASIGSLIGLAEILFGIIFGIIFFKESLNSGVIIGGALIIISATLPNIAKENKI